MYTTESCNQQAESKESGRTTHFFSPHLATPPQSFGEVLDSWIQFSLKHGSFSSIMMLSSKGWEWSGLAPAWVCFQLQSSQVRAATAGLHLVPWLRHFHLSSHSLSPLTCSVPSCTGALCSCRYFYCFPEACGPLENCLENCLHFLKTQNETKPLLILKKWGGSRQK